ncbi:hypothetical protein [Bradyrhizobium sp. Leo121]|uniref:hypothetical protein n=1 Tax=Bradyrhizobium sp. Leo121 TaxID=1571195 RepID=UPI0013EF36E0|nr:hypothetical protein [Bradyrhizobium sp. Leo121]
MVDWTILSPTFLTATVEWAEAVVTVLTVARATRPAISRTGNDDDGALPKARR